MPFPRSKPLKYCLLTLAVLVLLVGLLIGAFQFAVTRVPEYRGQLQAWVSERTGLAIEFERISARLRLYGPELVFDDAVVRTPDRTRVLATARRGSVAFDLWASLRALRLTAGRFTLDSPEIGLIRTSEGRVQLLGHNASEDQGPNTIALESLPVGQFRVRNAVISFRDEMTRRGPWSVSGISFRLERHPELLELSGEASLPRSLGQSLKFSGQVAGRLENVESLVTTFAIQGEALDLAGWADVLPDEWQAPETGHGSVLLSTAFHGAQPVAVTAEVALTDVSAALPAWVTPLPGPDPLIPKADDDDDDSDEPASDAAAEVEPEEQSAAVVEPPTRGAELIGYDTLAFDLEARRTDGVWSAEIRDLDMSRKSSPWRAKRIALKWSRPATDAFEVEAGADRIVLDNVWPLLAYLPESEALAKVRALNARGTVTDLSFSMARAPDAGSGTTYELQADVNKLGIDPVLKAPGVSGITAHVEGTNVRGAARVDSHDVAFHLPRMFRSALGTDSLQGVVTWEKLQQAWRIGSEQLRIDGADGKGDVRLAVTIPDDQSSPRLELEAQGHDLNAAATSRYLPANKLSPKTLAWLDAAFAEGRVATADVHFTGPVRAFPFRHGEGEFVARAAVKDLKFNYQNGWAPAESAETIAEFRNEGMRVMNGTALIGGLQVSDISGDFADFKAGKLNVKARAAGDLHAALQVLQTSPLAQALGQPFQTLRGKGQTVAHVDLHLPLKRLSDRRVTVTTELSAATVASTSFEAPITGLSGSLIVRDTLPAEAKLHGDWLGGPLEVVIDPIEADAPAAQLRASGHANAAQLTKLLHLPASAKLSGATAWSMSTRLEAGGDAQEGVGRDSSAGRPRQFLVESDLEGLAIGLPDPVSKPETERRPLRVELQYDGDRTVLTRAALGDIRALMRMQRRDDGWRLDRGGIRPDGIAAALPAHPGFSIEGSLERLDLDQWFALRGDGGSSGSLSDVLQSANLRVGQLTLFGYSFPDVRGLLRSVGSTWQVNVAGTNAEGELKIPADFGGSQPLEVKLERLVIERDTEGKRSESGRRDPRSWPNLNVFVRDLRYEEHAIGTISLQTVRVPNGVRVESLTLVHEAVRGDANGEWLVLPDGERSQMSATVTSTDVAATLRGLGYSAFMEAKRGEITADLSWPGGFDDGFPARASGKVAVAAENGQLLNVQPGAGRMLGLFSVAALPRRLALDFSDLTDKGLSFDTVHGDFELRDGNAYTSNLLLRGPAAEIGIAGRTGLGSRDYDQTAVVTGNLGASLPVAGALAGGPAVGAALLLFSQVFKEPLKGMTRGYYRITGPWENPIVERVDAAQVKEAAAATTREES